MKAVLREQVPLSECAARWHPELGWFDAALNVEALLELKALGVLEKMS